MPRQIKPRRPPEERDNSAQPGEDDDVLSPLVIKPVEETEPSSSSALRASIPCAPKDRPRLALPSDLKLDKKSKAKALELWGGAQGRRRLDTFMQKSAEEARKKYGHNAVLIGDDVKNLVCGIPCPALSFQYLSGQDIFPLGMIIQLLGKWGSLKSALLYEFFRWFELAGGGGFLKENETKFSADLCASLMGHDSFAECPIQVARCDSVEGWQESTTTTIDQLKKYMKGTKEEPGPGRTQPFLIGIDSIMGKVTRETLGKVQEAGSLGRNHPVEALMINNYMKSLPQMIDNWPVGVVLVNHLKPRKDEKGHDVRGKSGGMSVDFQESFEYETRKVRDLQSSQWDGVEIAIKCIKSSYGNTGRLIHTRMLWWEEDDPVTAEPMQRTFFDWGWSTVHMLTTLQGRLKERLDNSGFHLKAEHVSPVQADCWSKTLGIPKGSPLSWTETGDLIHADPDLMLKLRRALAIKQRPLLAGDYLRQLEAKAGDLP
jgi:hypothetical protein